MSGFSKWILTTLGGAGLVLALKKLIDFAGHDSELGLNTLKPVELLIPPLKYEFITENTCKRFNNIPKALGWLESLSDEDKSTLFAFFSRQTSVADYLRQAK